MSQHPDQRYIDKVLRGDTNAYAILVDRYKNMVFSIALGILKNREDSEEVAQDVFVKAYKALGSFRGSAAFSTWLYKITYRSSLDYLKMRRRNAGPEFISTNDGYPLQAVQADFNHADEDERNALVRKAISALSSEDQVLIRLFYYDEKSLKEIAEIMEITVNTAKVRLFRSRDRLIQTVRKISEGETIK